MGIFLVCGASEPVAFMLLPPKHIVEEMVAKAAGKQHANVSGGGGAAVQRSVANPLALSAVEQGQPTVAPRPAPLPRPPPPSLHADIGPGNQAATDRSQAVGEVIQQHSVVLSGDPQEGWRSQCVSPAERWQNAQHQTIESRRSQLLEAARQAAAGSPGAPMEAGSWAGDGTSMAAVVRVVQSQQYLGGPPTAGVDSPQLSLMRVDGVRTPQPLSPRR